MGALEEKTCASSELTPVEWSEMLELTHLAFGEHLRNGLNMGPCTMSLERFKEWLKGCQVFQIREDGELIAYKAGLVVRRIFDVYFQVRLTSVSPAKRKMGLGRRVHRLLEDWAVSQGCAFLQTDTSCEAKSSQAYHHSCGFEDWGYGSWKNTNYYTLILRKLLPSGRKYNPLLRRIALSLSYVCCHLMYDRYGNERIIGKMVNIPYRWVKKFVKRLLWGILGKRR